jgi:hypothetical protein
VAERGPASLIARASVRPALGRECWPSGTVVDGPGLRRGVRGAAEAGGNRGERRTGEQPSTAVTACAQAVERGPRIPAGSCQGAPRCLVSSLSKVK